MNEQNIKIEEEFLSREELDLLRELRTLGGLE